MKPEPSTSAVIVAAGTGSRMGGVSKPLIPLGGITVFERVLAAFSSCRLITEIIVVCRDSTELEKLAARCGVKAVFTEGGKLRSESVANGVAASHGSFVCIHDCARPFIKTDDIEKVILAAYDKGASCACAPVYDTVKYIDRDKNMIYTPARDKLFALQTPQVFKKDIYTVSYAKAVSDGIAATDETAIAENAGFYVEYVEIGNYNRKLTDAEDVRLAKAAVFLAEHDKKDGMPK